MRSGLARFGDVQRVIVESARSTFRGRLTYAAGTWEDVEWDAFDIVSIDAYRDAGNEAGYRDQIRTYGRFGKPAAVTEFGCCTFAGASARGGTGWLIFDPKADPPQLDGRYQRDEGEQVHYFQEMMTIHDTEKRRFGLLVQLRGLCPAAPRRAGTGSRHGVVWRRRHRGAIRASGRHHLGTLGGLPCHLGRLRAPSQPRSPVRQGATREDPSLAGGSVMTPLAYPY